ncbi:DNA polymerase [Candidatus Nitrosocosmicus franklandus]|uniref:DNA polymerase n=2 Tax=Candidatus Nitrosocosmicus franklandianus TaxID=1798806 RepID=A0A484I6F7_9ARCH|nr:DNA polymerase [Candidatus Nitrosocosmicus franklandus]
MIPENMPCLLLSSFYVGEKKSVFLKFYNPSDSQVYFWSEYFLQGNANNKHQPYCYVKKEFASEVNRIVDDEKTRYSIQEVKKLDDILDKEIDILKILAPDPLAIGGTDNSFREKVTSWEADIKYHESYMYDMGLIPGAYYKRVGNSLVLHEFSISKGVDKYLNTLFTSNKFQSNFSNNEYDKFLLKWSRLLNQPIPNIKRLALDIEVDSEEGRMPTAREHDRVITAVGISSSDGLKKVYVLKKGSDVQLDSLDQSIEVCETEKEMLLKVFQVIQNYPIILTYNGDDFDLPYLYARSQDPRIDPINATPIEKELVPIVIKRESFIKRGMQADPVTLQTGIHIDLFRTFQNRSVQNYAFSHKYSEYTLNAISEALLEDTKIEFEGSIGDLSIQKLAEYCLKDADLTYRLSSFNDNLLMKLIVIIARISRMSIEDITRFGVNQWIRSMMFFEHRQQNIIIPRRDELLQKGSSSTTAIIKEKKYRGGLVVEPELGIHFNVVVVDFASLYPSIIKVHNLSYETVNCPHDECRKNPINHIEGTTHWICRKKRGMTSILIGTLRDLRVNYYKHLSKDKTLNNEDRQLYSVISQAIKVILNATYGVMGAEIFPLYCLPVAEATAAIGRSTTTKTIRKCNEDNVKVIYGDTDSLFLKNPTDEQLKSISNWAKTELGVDLEIDKRYRYVVFSALKKNYLGVLDDGTVDVKGLTGKKSHTPPFIRKAFYEILNVLRDIYSEKDFTNAKTKIKEIIRSLAEDLENRKIPLAELSFNVMINKSPEKYGVRSQNNNENHTLSLGGKSKDFGNVKGIPQHIKAAKQLVELGQELKAGDIISYVKTRTVDGVKPVSLVSKSEVDNEKYLEAMEATFDQVLSSLNLNFKSIIGKPRQSNLDELFWG